MATEANEKPAPTPVADTREATLYQLLKKVVVQEGRVGEGEAWAEVTQISATNKTAALRKGIEKLGEADREGEFKAVAQSAWTGGLKAHSETVTQMKFEDLA